ncbi:hypothetical protein E2493_14845 [Sphingomonas parva]|uniref:Serine--tRNA ligase n=1 Tax=Sphingomonas parva TaxID=2555898 RepID=A0A4Y8ZQD1_9SPHN|nr:hypothetical protein [Sphingomonas parva]TFI57482.1 hypothetical protein E2493_14845 [Sphingomonas parva]
MESLHPEFQRAVRLVLEGRRNVGRQIEKIAALKAKGADVALAEARLEGLTLALEGDCERLERLLTLVPPEEIEAAAAASLRA